VREDAEPKWSLPQLRAASKKFEAELLASGASGATVESYRPGVERFLRWLAGGSKPDPVDVKSFVLRSPFDDSYRTARYQARELDDCYFCQRDIHKGEWVASTTVSARTMEGVRDITAHIRCARVR
jgi:hypothetical protein